MMTLKPDKDAMNDQIVTRPCNWLYWENAPMLNAALIAVMVEMTNEAPAASTSPNRIALTTTRMKANTTMSGRPRSPGASMIEAQQTSSPNNHRLPSGQCAAKRSKLLRLYAIKRGPKSSAPAVARHSVAPARALAIGLAAYGALELLAFATTLVLRATPFGLQVRAVTQNRRMAASMGISTARVDMLAFGLGSGVAGIAGVALSQIDNVSPNLGQGYIIDSFMVVVFGGVGNLWGTAFGALLIGLANKLLEPLIGAVQGQIVLLIFIILFIQRRPRGLFALRGRAVEA